MINLGALERNLEKLPLEPRNHTLYHEIGVILLEVEDYGNACRYLQRACALSCDNVDSLRYYAKALYEMGVCREAVETLKKYLKLVLDDRDAMELLADGYYRLGEFKAAASAMRMCGGMENEQ